ncbi:hypothetical protein [uncultured Flavobacterium sp.]|uniref:hypothetical protein n=1 Tax=uncultured Flavobacterium sp. TaxID=165435 RepID=UPI002596DA19|nr:hypothetical protein [uncultured Flavobacterium sp.]
MKQTIYLNDFRDAFHDCGRKENFSYNGLEALYDFLTEIEEGSGIEQELDVIAICCDFTEYENLAEYNREHDPVSSVDEIEEETIVIAIDAERFIIQNF